jgi:uncharacterized protein YndB with AHSA1/START domain
MSTTRARRHLNAPRSRVYAALTEPADIVRWKVPSNMTAEMNEFDGESFRMSLTYDEPDRVGKTSARTDTYRGRFTQLVLDERVVEVDEFETDDPDLAGAMTITITLTEADGGTDLSAVHDGIPAAVRPEDNELGWQESLDRLADLVEREQ